jgi:hypothetical protein
MLTLTTPLLFSSKLADFYDTFHLSESFGGEVSGQQLFSTSIVLKSGFLTIINFMLMFNAGAKRGRKLLDNSRLIRKLNKTSKLCFRNLSQELTLWVSVLTSNVGYKTKINVSKKDLANSMSILKYSSRNVLNAKETLKTKTLRTSTLKTAFLLLQVLLVMETRQRRKKRQVMLCQEIPKISRYKMK